MDIGANTISDADGAGATTTQTVVEAAVSNGAAGHGGGGYPPFNRVCLDFLDKITVCHEL